MKQCVHGVVYNTDRAVLLSSTDAAKEGKVDDPGDRGYWREDLYITPGGDLFIHGSSNAGGIYGTAEAPGEVIMPVDNNELLCWCGGFKAITTDPVTGCCDVHLFHLRDDGEKEW